MLDGTMDLTPGLGTITMEVTGADAVIESLSSKVYEDEESLPVSITATSEETSNAAENEYDKDGSHNQRMQILCLHLTLRILISTTDL